MVIKYALLFFGVLMVFLWVPLDAHCLRPYLMSLNVTVQAPGRHLSGSFSLLLLLMHVVSGTALIGVGLYALSEHPDEQTLVVFMGMWTCSMAVIGLVLLTAFPKDRLERVERIPTRRERQRRRKDLSSSNDLRNAFTEPEPLVLGRRRILGACVIAVLMSVCLLLHRYLASLTYQKMLLGSALYPSGAMFMWLVVGGAVEGIWKPGSLGAPGSPQHWLSAHMDPTTALGLGLGLGALPLTTFTPVLIHLRMFELPLYWRCALGFLPTAALLFPLTIYLAWQTVVTLCSELLASIKGYSATLISSHTKDEISVLLWLCCHCLVVGMLALSGANPGDTTMLGILILGMPLFVLGLYYRVWSLLWPMLCLALLVPAVAGTLTLTGVPLVHENWAGPVYIVSIGLPLAIVTILSTWQMSERSSFDASNQDPPSVEAVNWRWTSWLCMLVFIPLGVLAPLLTIWGARLEVEVEGAGALAFVALFLGVTLAVLGANNASNVLELERRAKVSVHRIRELLRAERVLLSPLLGRRIVDKFFDREVDFGRWFQYRLNDPSTSDHENDFLGVGLHSQGAQDGAALYKVQEIDRLFEESADHIGPGRILEGPALDTPRPGQSARPQEDLFAARALLLLDELKRAEDRRCAAATRLQRAWRVRRARRGAQGLQGKVLGGLQHSSVRRELQRVHTAYAACCQEHSSGRLGQSPRICVTCLYDFLEDAQLHKYAAETMYQLHAYSRRLRTLEELLLWCANGREKGQQKLKKLFGDAGINTWDDLQYTGSLIPHVGLSGNSARHLKAVLESVMRKGDTLKFSAFYQLLNTIAQLRFGPTQSPASPRASSKSVDDLGEAALAGGVLGESQQPLQMLHTIHIANNPAVVRAPEILGGFSARESHRRSSLGDAAPESSRSVLGDLVPSGYSNLIPTDPMLHRQIDEEIELLELEADREDLRLISSAQSSGGSFDRRTERWMHDKVERLILDELNEVARVAVGEHQLGADLSVDWQYLGNLVAVLGIACDLGAFLTIAFAEGIWFDSGSRANDGFMVFGFEIVNHSKWLGFLIASLVVVYTFPFVAYHGMKLSTLGRLGRDEFGNRARGCSWMGVFVAVLSVYSTVLFFPVCKTLCNTLICVYHEHESAYHIDMTHLQCWEPVHLALVAASMLGLVLYLPVASCLYPRIQFADPSLDIKYLPGYLTMLNLCRLLIVGVEILVHSKYGALLAGIPVVCVALWLELSVEPCFVRRINHVRTLLYACVLWIYVMSLGVLHFGDRTTGVVGIGVGCGLVWIVYITCSRPCCDDRPRIVDGASRSESTRLLGNPGAQLHQKQSPRWGSDPEEPSTVKEY